MAARELVDARERLFATLADNAPVGVFVTDADGASVYSNKRLSELSGVPSEESLGLRWVEALHPEDAERVQAEWTAAAAEGRDFHTEYRFRRLDGSVRWIEASASAVRDADGVLLGWVGCCVDLTERKVSHERYRQLVEHATDPIFAANAEGTITAINRAGELLTGYTRDELVGMSLFALLAPEDLERARKTFERRLETGENEMAEYRLIARDGRSRFVEVSAHLIEENGVAVGVEAIARDTTERRALEEKLRQQALHDPLTGLPNRTLFHDRLTKALRRAERSASPVAVMLLDLDGFKQVNDTLGHAAGDQLLVELAPRLRSGLRGSDSVARLGGDEFGFIVEGVAEERELVAVAERLLAAVAEPVAIGPDRQVQVTASLGIAIADPSSTADSALSSADTAMYSAKNAGKSRHAIYSESPADSRAESDARRHGTTHHQSLVR